MFVRPSVRFTKTCMKVTSRFETNLAKCLREGIISSFVQTYENNFYQLIDYSKRNEKFAQIHNMISSAKSSTSYTLEFAALDCTLYCHTLCLPLPACFRFPYCSFLCFPPSDFYEYDPDLDFLTNGYHGYVPGKRSRCCGVRVCVLLRVIVYGDRHNHAFNWVF